jgi:hypothetical protein
MQEAAGSSPAPPTTRHFTLKLTALRMRDATAGPLQRSVTA